ncbi:9529_t:CDS:2 [Paraglomus brasilianum]|uniref:9529_t:CDS:1 n=1 Tax=Paraglomus brasilianum TaxID=144538 RepID=A0A9N9B0I5_9GLOM|nr:9529_t:CDS:2 [Paraglomus brasilianum]
MPRFREPLSGGSTTLEDDLKPTSHLPSHQTKKSHSSFDRIFIRRLLRIFRIILSPRNPEGNVLWLWLTFMAVCFIKEITVYYVGTIPSRFYGVFVGKDWDGFKVVLMMALLFVIAAGVGKSLVQFINGLFALTTRRILTRYIQTRYVNGKTLYRLLVWQPEIDNPDQRITQDTSNFSTKLASILSEVIITPVLIIYYTYKCFVISGYLGPMLIYLYFVVGTVCTRFLIPPIVELVFLKEQQEGYFRFLHVRIRNYVESIAFSWGEKGERTRLDELLMRVLGYQRKIVYKELSLQAVTEAFGYFGSVVSYMVIAIPLFSGKYDDIPTDELSAIIALNAFLSIYLVYLFTVVVQRASDISDLAGYTARIGQLLETIDDIENRLENVGDIDSRLEHVDSDFLLDQQPNAYTELSISFDRVAIKSPAGKTLLTDLRFTIEQNKNVIILGPNGSGKTSLLRTMSGLWPAYEGAVNLPHATVRQKVIVYLPQTPYLAYGSLRDQITYPVVNSFGSSSITDETIRKILSKVGLLHIEKICGDFDTVYGQEWNTMLSPGEQQKLAFARLFYWKPVFAAFDEATSSLDSTLESQFFVTCKSLGITCITVSHNRNLLKYHDQVLLLDGRGHYTTSDIDIDGTEDIERWIDQTLRASS